MTRLSCSLAFNGIPRFANVFSTQPQKRSSLSSLALELRNLRVLAIISVHKKAPPLVELFYGAGDEARTRDIFLGKEAFYH